MKAIFISVFISASIIWIFLFAFLAVQKIQAQNVAVSVTVASLRIIVVDKNLTIQQVISNTGEDVQPIILENSPDGQQLPDNEDVMRKYGFLKPSLDFSKPGIIYKKEESPIEILYKTILRILTNLK